MKTHSKATILIIAVMALAVATACTQKTDEARTVYSVSFPMQKSLLEEIVGDKASINTLIPTGTNPETYDPSVSTLVSLGKSKAYFRLNTPGFEEAIMAKSGRNFEGLDLVDCSRGISLIEGTHGEGYADPHIWTSVRNAVRIADNMYAYVSAHQPKNASAFRKNHDRLHRRLTLLDDSVSRILAGSKGTAFVVMHPSLSYFARDYGLTQVAMETDGKEASPRQLAQRMENARKSGAKVLIHDKEHSPAQAREIASQLGLRLVLVSLNGDDWEKEMVRIANAIAANK